MDSRGRRRTRSASTHRAVAGTRTGDGGGSGQDGDVRSDGLGDRLDLRDDRQDARGGQGDHHGHPQGDRRRDDQVDC